MKLLRFYSTSNLIPFLTLLTIVLSASAFAQFPTLPYHPCVTEPSFYAVPTAPFTYSDWITNVTFAGINNTTGAVAWRNNYSGTTHASVVRGQAYTISVIVNSAGADFSYQYIGAFIDWDRNGDCGGKPSRHGGTGEIAGECYDLGSGAGHPNPVTRSITVPSDAAIGTTWLRVTLKADGLPATETYLGYFGYGEIEEYALDVYYAAPTTQTSSILLPSNAAGTQLNISWTNGNGTSRVVFMKQGTGAITNPSNNSTYTASANWSSKGTQLGSSGYYCIYNGTGNSIVISNTTALTQYTIQVFEYNNASGHEQYYTSTATGNPSNATSLPVELASFTAAALNNSAALAWKTATEKNNYGFEIERRVVGSASQWFKIGFVAGNGTSSKEHTYSFADANVSSGTYVYRLKQIDNDGTYKYSGEAEVTITMPTVFALNQNYPNPFNPTTTISFTLAQDGYTTLKIYDVLGKEVATLVNGEMKAGVQNTITFDASKLSSGVYFSRLQNSGSTQIKKLVLMK